MNGSPCGTVSAPRPLFFIYAFVCVFVCLGFGFPSASRNKYVVVGLGGATIRMAARLESPVLKVLPQGTVSLANRAICCGVHGEDRFYR